MITFEALENARFDGLRAHAGVWSGTMHRLDDLARDFEYGVCAGTEAAGWTGDAAGLADAELETVLRRIRVAGVEARSIAAELDFAVDELAGAQTRLFSEMYSALRDGVSVTGQGERFTVTEAVPNAAPRDPATELAWKHKIEDYTRRVQAILDQAADADARHSAALARLSPFEVASADDAAWKNAAEDLSRTFAFLDPTQAAAWWTSLSEAKRRTYLAEFGPQIGGMDGIPCTVRDEANRTTLSARLAVLAPLIAGGTATYAQKREWDNLRAIQNALATDPNRPPESRLLLLKFGNRARDGEVVIAVGNPDTAASTAVFVPGVNATVSGKLDEHLARTTRLQTASDRLTRDEPGDAAAVLWLDYDAPEATWTGFSSSLGPSRAEEGANRLGQFVDGVRATAPQGGRVTVTGHSYGSDVVAYAARTDKGLAANDIILIGSPGVHVDKAADLHMNPDHVFVEQADADFIAPAGGMVHGRLPSDPAFGATRLPTNPGGHFSYWDLNPDQSPEESLAAQARVTMGFYDTAKP
ncbi:alpha/beta hydrolase [Yinghuangia seranimata]|uniref:alpha/beta hydrolase n=1 Tax=Yinghuangia seranimata TaxID=408067 RepID=UPI00248D01D2|nr:alpha/beta hydrolase [Yinghuangia seranimata]MDI2128260.1 alpha/beta hydrolase [Yinghuangia seranimata]